MNLPKRDAKGRFISSNTVKSKNLAKNSKKLDLIGILNTIKRQNNEIKRLNKEANFWRVMSVIFIVIAFISFLAYLQVGY